MSDMISINFMFEKGSKTRAKISYNEMCRRGVPRVFTDELRIYGLNYRKYVWRVSTGDVDRGFSLAALKNNQKEKFEIKALTIDQILDPPQAPGSILFIFEDKDTEKKRRLQESRLKRGWKPYVACDGELVNVPGFVHDILTSCSECTPAPREEFTRVLQNVQSGQIISMPSLGQPLNNHPFKNSDSTFLVTQQMIDIWESISAGTSGREDMEISGPIGSGKSYILYFLAAKAYSEGRMVLFISEQTVALGSTLLEQKMSEIFFAMNKNILTSNVMNGIIETMQYYDGYYTDINYCIHSILLYMETRMGTLKIFDYPLKRVPIFRNLIYQSHKNGSKSDLCIGYMAKTIESSCRDWSFYKIEYVRPIPDDEFDRLVELNPLLNSPITISRVKMVVNNNPLELSRFSHRLSGLNIDLSSVEQVNKQLNLFRLNQHPFRFSRLPIKELKDSKESDFESLGKDIFKIILRPSILEKSYYHIALLGSTYKWEPLGEHKSYLNFCFQSSMTMHSLLKLCDLKDVEIPSYYSTEYIFEAECLKNFLTETPKLFLKTLRGDRVAPITIKSKRIDLLSANQYTLDPSFKESLVRCHPEYPVFDFICHYVFMITTIKTFRNHNRGEDRIDNAFNRPFMNDPKNRNQIETYLDSVYGSEHRAIIDQSRKFVVTRNGFPVKNFKIVFLSTEQTPYTRLAGQYQDLLFGKFE